MWVGIQYIGTYDTKQIQYLYFGEQLNLLFDCCCLFALFCFCFVFIVFCAYACANGFLLGFLFSIQEVWYFVFSPVTERLSTALPNVF